MAAGWRAAGAVAFCSLPVLVGFAVPVAVLFEMAVSSEQNPFSARYVGFITNSLTVSFVAALVTMGGAVIIGYLVRLKPGRGPSFIKTVAGMGYAIPGGVIAVGLFALG